ncbi:hypothetical protein [Streptomyces flavidovirens]|uniref:Uncharacterized protein n=1 Tax=Streptomyces flavidovirens TaxID=67298 RepID=A0ABW6RNN7_9ACTN
MFLRPASAGRQAFLEGHVEVGPHLAPGGCREGFEKTLSDWSTAGPVAYVEAEYFGGVGEQKAAVWYGGTIVLGPLHVQAGRHFRLLAVRSLRHFDGWA